MTTLTDLDAFEARIAAEAALWTTYFRVGPWESHKTEHDSLAAAKAHALATARAADRRVMVYAVTPAGRSVMLGAATPAGTFAGALRS